MKRFTTFIHTTASKPEGGNRWKPDHIGFESATEADANRIADNALKHGAVGIAVLKIISAEGETLRYTLLRKEGDIRIG